MARFSPVLPLVGGGHTRFQPVFAGDVASAVVAAIEGRAEDGQIYELGGPEVKSFKELMQFVLATIGRRRLLLPIPFALARLQASVLQLMPKPLLTPDQVELLQQRQRRVGGGQARRPHARGARHRSRRHGDDRAVVSVAVPQDRPVRRRPWQIGASERRAVLRAPSRAHPAPDTS